MGITTWKLFSSDKSLINAGELESFKLIIIESLSIWDAISVKYLLLKLILISSELKFTFIFSVPSPQLGLLTDNFRESFFKILNRNLQNENTFIISHKGDILFDKFTNTIKFEKYKNFARLVWQQ